MAIKDKRIDAYISNAESFAQKIMKKLRAYIHKAEPQIKETIKWGAPSFESGEMVCGISTFKKHVHFSFWKAKILEKDKKLLKEVGKDTISQLKKIRSIDELPDEKIIITLIKTANQLNVNGTKRPIKSSAQIKKELHIPDYFIKAIKTNKRALKTFESFSPGYQRDYVEWVLEAKREETRQKRLATTVEWLSEGKTRNWKHQNC